MNSWKEVRLGDYVQFQNGYAFKSSDFKINGDYKIVKIKELKDGLVKFFDDTATVDCDNLKNFEKYKIEKNDVLFALTGDPVSKPNPLSWVGRVSIYRNTDKAFLNQRTCKILKSDTIDNIFLYYYFRQWENFFGLASKATGSASQANISTSTIGDTVINLPPLPTQQRIARILSSLDDKIELNNKINANLEQQAQALFKSWFVDFEPFGGEMPAEWKEKPLYEYADFINGTSFKEDEYGTIGVPIIKIAELKNGITDATQYFNGTKDSKYDVKDGDILFSWSGNPETSIDIFIWTLGNAILNQHTFNVKSNTNRKWFTYCLLKYFKPEFCHRAGCKQTTGLGHVTANDLKQIMFSSAENSENDFENLITPIMEQIYNNKKENQKLASIRDTLLPKLMNGEIKI